MQRYIEGNESRNEDRKNIFLNTNKLPKIITRLSLSNFHKKSNNNNDIPVADSNNKGTINKFNIFNRTSGGMGFKGITFNNGLAALRSTNYKFNKPRYLPMVLELDGDSTITRELIHQTSLRFSIINHIS